MEGIEIMAYFPLFQDLTHKKIKIFGGGRVALRKAEKLLPFDPEITVIAPEILPEFGSMPLTLFRREYRDGDVDDNLYCVIAACNDREVNRQIYEACQKKNIPVNTVDDPALCTFLFPSLVKKGPLTVGISTSGTSPTAAIWIREQLEEILPEETEKILLWLREQRERMKSELPTEKKRALCQRRLFAACMEQGHPLTDEQRDSIIETTKKVEE